MKKYLFPVKIAAESGAENAASLLKEKTLQISLSEPDCCILHSGDHIILDYGKEVCGGVRILAHLGEGKARIRIRFGESLTETCSEIGEKGSTNDHALRDLETELPAYTDQTFGQTGFRFVRIDVISENTVLPLKAAAAVISFLEREPVGTFTCDDERVNRIWETASYTVRLCMQNGYFWDGIKRDRLVWIGDIYPEMRAAHCLFPEVPEVISSLRFSSRETPLPGWINGYATYSLWWLIILADEMNRFGGGEPDEELLAYAEGILRQFADCVQNDGSLRFKDGFVFVDWPSLPIPGQPEWKKEDLESGVHAIARICLQKAKDIKGLSPEAKELCLELLEKLGNRPGSRIHLKQIAGLCTMAGDLSEDNREVLRNGGPAGLSTFMSYFILTAMAQYADQTEAFRAMKEYYGGMLDLGATSFWEDFDLEWAKNSCRIDSFPQEGQDDIHGDHGAFCYTGFRHSLCHGWSSGVIAYLAETVAGIHEEGTEGNTYRITPHLGDLHELSITYPTGKGPLKVHCRRNENGEVTVDCSAPEGILVIK